MSYSSFIDPCPHRRRRDERRSGAIEQPREQRCVKSQGAHERRARARGEYEWLFSEDGR